MTTGKGGKHYQDNAQLALSQLNKPRGSCFANDAEKNYEVFLAASLHFLHRLLAERISHHCLQLDFDGISTPQELQNEIRQGNSTQKQNRVKYKQQLRATGDFSTIQFEKNLTSNIDANMFVPNKTYAINEEGNNMQNFGTASLGYDSHDVNILKPPLRSFEHSHSFLNYDKLPGTTSDQVKIGIELEGQNPNIISQKIAPDAAGDFSYPSLLRVKSNSVQSRCSYANIMRNAVSSLAKNCSKRRNSRKSNYAGNNRVPKVGTMEHSQDCSPSAGGYESEVESEISSESHVRNKRDSTMTKQIPVCMQLATESDTRPKNPVTLLVKVPNTVSHLLNRKISKEHATISNTGPFTGQGKTKRRLTSVLLNLLKGRKTPSSTTVSSMKEKVSSNLTLSTEEADCNIENIATTKNENDDVNHNTLIHMLQKSMKKNSESTYSAQNQQKINEISSPMELNCKIDNKHVGELTSVKSERYALELPVKGVNACERFSLNLSPTVANCELKSRTGQKIINTTPKFTADGTLQPELIYDEREMTRDSTSYENEKIIPLHFSEGSPQLGNKRSGTNKPDIDMFLNLVTEMKRTQTHRNINDKHVEIPVAIRTTKIPLHLRKSRNISNSFLEDHAFRTEMKTPKIPNGITTEEFLQMLIRALPEVTRHSQGRNCDNSYNKSKDLFTLRSMKNETQNDSKLFTNYEDSALEVLLRHIATAGTPKSCTKLQPAEEDTTVQTVPKRQLSKISVCYSSESLSGSDHDEVPGFGIKDSIISQDGHKVYNDQMDSELRSTLNGEPDSQKCSDQSQATEKFHRIHSQVTDRQITNDEFSFYNVAGLNQRINSRIVAPREKAEITIEERHCRCCEMQVNSKIVKNSEKTCLSVRETGSKTIFFHPVLSKQIYEDRKELADAMIRWWGPQINYSTTPSSQTQVSTYSVSINNLI